MAKAKTKKTIKMSANGNGQSSASNQRIGIQKTYKLFIGGQFPRTESGRYFTLTAEDGNFTANICRGSRKDFRNSVVVARKAFPGWASRAPFNRSQILYRIAEMMEGRSAQFREELQQLGLKPAEAKKEVEAAIDRMVYFAGWCDKYQQVFSSVNPVASSHFNFSAPEPMGVVVAFAPESPGLLGLVSMVAPIIAGGNTAIILASASFPTLAITFGEVLNSSDVPGGVVNILTGYRDELKGHFSTHMDVNAMVWTGSDLKEWKEIQLNATENVKRTVKWDPKDWFSDESESPYPILDLQEVKTTWHPIGK